MAGEIEKASFFQRLAIPFLAWLLFAAIFAAVVVLKPAVTTEVTNEKMLQIFQQFAVFGGLGFGLISLLASYLLYGARAIFKLKKVRAVAPIILILAYAGWAGFGYQLMYREPRYTSIAKAIIAFLGEPLLYAGLAMVGLGLVWFFLTLIPRRSNV